MQAKELRIGNLVNHCTGQREIGGILIDSVEFMPKEELSYGATLEDIDPITLTEEWLLKFGFDIPYQFVASKGEIHLAIEQGICRYYVNSEYWKDIDYVHSLQNLYFALTGEELKY